TSQAELQINAGSRFNCQIQTITAGRNAHGFELGQAVDTVTQEISCQRIRYSLWQCFTRRRPSWVSQVYTIEAQPHGVTCHTLEITEYGLRVRNCGYAIQCGQTSCRH